MIELRHLRYAVAVADEGHVTRAAERLGIQQPPLSQQIRVLERAVGAPLFQRLPRGVRLTEPGRVLVERARLVLQDVDAALEAARRAARGEQGRLAVGYTTSAAFHPLVSAVVRGLRDAAPGIALSLEEGSTGDLIELLRADRLDAAFVRAPAARPDGLIVEPLHVEEMLVALPDHHPLAAVSLRRQRLSLAALANETFVLNRRPSGPGLYDDIIAACRAAGFSPMVGQETPRMVSTLSLVSAGLGLSIVPASMAKLETNGIVYRRLDDTTRLTAPLYLARRADEPSPSLSKFLDMVRRRA
ncbi:LysR family transcriptional regulator [Labrys sp. ZIDIC5]|uniref:LysR family transcriptional regulator n=1 Tax=Labrys sedimenti TaxID=3106036 RepID=UPI002ACA3289|nr:LysR family transcriptional regulator [Labrys sp. ZIDIC5]MDZ5451779.1 LysR family transcriptional regulator [Labrys sp. ZIDIC5]